MLSLEVIPLPVTEPSPASRHDRPRGGEGEAHRSRCRRRRGPAQGAGRDLGRRVGPGAGSAASQLRQLRRLGRQQLDLAGTRIPRVLREGSTRTWVFPGNKGLSAACPWAAFSPRNRSPSAFYSPTPPPPTAGEAGRRMDRLQRERAPAPRTRALAGRVLSADRCSPRCPRQRGPDHGAPRPRRDCLVHGRRRGPTGRPGRLAVPRPSRPRRPAPGPRRLRLACDGRVLRGRRAHRGPRRRRLPSHRHPPELTPTGRQGRGEADRGDQAAARAVRVRLRASLVRPLGRTSTGAR
jgi:hypothetical protein